MKLMRKNCISRKWPLVAYCIVSLQMVLCLCLACTGCVYTEKREYMDTYGHLQPWLPTRPLIIEAVRSAREFCENKYPSVGFSSGDNNNDEIDVTVTSSYISFNLSSSNQTQIGSFDDRYSMLALRMGTFVENNAGGRLRFIAVQHFLKDSYNEWSTRFTPFTIYYNADTGKAARNTVKTWTAGSGAFDFPDMIYSPGPPYFLPGGALGEEIGTELGSSNNFQEDSGIGNGTAAGSD